MSESNLKFNLSTTANHKVDVMFLADATGSMQPAMDNVKTNILSAYKKFKTQVTWDVKIGIAFYRDQSDVTPFKVLQTITGDADKIQNAANKLVADGGGDRPEGQMAALTMLASRSVAGWRPGSTRIIAWFGDEPGHNPVVYNGISYSLSGAIESLLERNVQVCAFSVSPSNRLDETGQATAITESADGVLTNQYVQYNVKQAGVVDFIFNFIQGDTP